MAPPPVRLWLLAMDLLWPRSVASSTSPLISEPLETGVPFIVCSPSCDTMSRSITLAYHRACQSPRCRGEAGGKVKCGWTSSHSRALLGSPEGPREQAPGDRSQPSAYSLIPQEVEIGSKATQRVLALRWCHNSFMLMRDASSCPYADNLHRANNYPNPTWSGKDTELGWALMTDSS